MVVDSTWWYSLQEATSALLSPGEIVHWGKGSEKDSGRREEVNGWIKGSLTDGSRFLTPLYVEGTSFITCFGWDREIQLSCGKAFTKQVSISFHFSTLACTRFPPFLPHLLGLNLYLETWVVFLCNFYNMLFTQTQKDKKYIDLIFLSSLHTHSISGSPSVDSDAAKIH